MTGSKRRRILTNLVRIYKPDDHIGIYHGSVPFSGTGAVVVTLSRNGANIAQVNGKAISSGCTGSLYNAWVGQSTVSAGVSAKPSLSISQQACINGTGVNNFAGLCGFGCEYVSICSPNRSALAADPHHDCL